MADHAGGSKDQHLHCGTVAFDFVRITSVCLVKPSATQSR